MTRAFVLILAAALCASLLAACDPAPQVVTKVVVELPAPPSPDLLADPRPPTTANAKNIGDVIEILGIAIKDYRRTILGWQAWFAAAKRSVEGKDAKP